MITTWCTGVIAFMSGKPGGFLLVARSVRASVVRPEVGKPGVMGVVSGEDPVPGAGLGAGGSDRLGAAVLVALAEPLGTLDGEALAALGVALLVLGRVIAEPTRSLISSPQSGQVHRNAPSWPLRKSDRSAAYSRGLGHAAPAIRTSSATPSASPTGSQDIPASHACWT